MSMSPSRQLRVKVCALAVAAMSPIALASCSSPMADDEAASQEQETQAAESTEIQYLDDDAEFGYDTGSEYSSGSSYGDSPYGGSSGSDDVMVGTQQAQPTPTADADDDTSDEPTGVAGDDLLDSMPEATDGTYAGSYEDVDDFSGFEASPGYDHEGPSSQGAGDASNTVDTEEYSGTDEYSDGEQLDDEIWSQGTYAILMTTAFPSGKTPNEHDLRAVKQLASRPGQLKTMGDVMKFYRNNTCRRIIDNTPRDFWDMPAEEASEPTPKMKIGQVKNAYVRGTVLTASMEIIEADGNVSWQDFAFTQENNRWKFCHV